MNGAVSLGGSAAVTEASGELVRRIRYGIWGEVRDNLEVVPAIASDPAEKFTGQRLDDFSGLLYYGARYYDPTLGRFTQPDSMIPDLTDPQAWNSYAYVLNDPLNRIDPTVNFSLSSVTGLFSSLFSPIGSAFQQTFHSTVSFVQSYVVSPLQTAWSSVKHFAGLAQTLVTAAFRMSSPPSENATNAAQVARGPGQSNAAAARSGANAGGGNWFQRFFRSVGEIARGEAGEISGILNTPAGIIRGLYLFGRGIGRLASGKFTAGLSDIGLGIGNIAAAGVMLRSGSTSGLLHSRGRSITGATGTRLDNAGFNHDGYRFSQMATNSSIQFGWVRDAWAGQGTELGPWGQAYRLYGTVGFGIIGVLQKAAGF